jgi:hypothetical protein
MSIRVKYCRIAPSAAPGRLCSTVYSECECDGLRGILASFVYAGSPNHSSVNCWRNWKIQKIGKVQLKNLIGKKVKEMSSFSIFIRDHIQSPLGYKLDKHFPNFSPRFEISTKF